MNRAFSKLTKKAARILISTPLFLFKVPAEVVEHFRTFYGPTQKAFGALESVEEKQAALRRDLENLRTQNNQATDGTTRVESEYLEVVARHEQAENAKPFSARGRFRTAAPAYTANFNR
jgi:hypothetical protein